MNPANARCLPCWLCALAALALLLGMALWLAPLHPGILALQLSFSPAAFARVVHAWGPDGLARFRAHLPFDYAFLVIYAALGFLLVRRTALFRAAAPTTRGLAAALLPLAALCDLGENLLLAWLTAVPRFDAPSQHLAAALCASFKWLLLLSFSTSCLIQWARLPANPSRDET